jgi:hypothetical protein
MTDLESLDGDDKRSNQRFNMERTMRAVANGELRLGRLTEVSATGCALHLDKDLDEGTEITIDIEELGSFSGHVTGPARDGLVPVKFDLDDKGED